MSKMPDELYESFKSNLEKVDGKCFRASKDTLAETLTGLFKELDIKDTCIAETPLLKEAGVAEALKNAGVEVFTDHIRLHAETAKGGISENQYGIAELGTMVQFGDEVDARLVGTMSESYFGVVGFITGPSRTADIECVGTVGVHGPIRLTAVVVDDM